MKDESPRRNWTNTQRIFDQLLAAVGTDPLARTVVSLAQVALEPWPVLMKAVDELGELGKAAVRHSLMYAGGAALLSRATELETEILMGDGEDRATDDGK